MSKYVLNLYLYLGFMQIVDRQNAETLLPIIQRHILPGSIVYSDQWAAYNRVGDIHGLEHQTVNHTPHFVDPVTGVHTQNIESYWNRCKTKIKTMKGVRRHMLPPWLSGRVHVARASRGRQIHCDFRWNCAAISGKQMKNLKTKKYWKTVPFETNKYIKEV